jgi:hypothetical protein
MANIDYFYREALATDSTDLIALISFVVNEKKKNKLSEPASYLVKYFNPKHKEYVNRHLIDYKRRKGPNYKSRIYIAWFNSFDGVVIKAATMNQARRLAETRSEKIKLLEARYDNHEFANGTTAADLLEQEKRETAIVGSFSFEDI